ncbi:unnamed protein product [Lupinus luteus]|uniref:Uncharacterized protein n=1 Tax=Lupinus luteus TaxID=3873 RepID=A0AAV1XT53_LUPLU
MAESHSPTPTLSPTISTLHDTHSGFDWMVLVAAILCAFLCALGLNTMLQCVFQCATRVFTEPMQWIASRRLNSGLKKKEMVALPTSTYTHSGSPSSSPHSSCAICLAEFFDGDQIRNLVRSNHLSHSFLPA